MAQEQLRAGAELVAASTVAAVHRRDHAHDGTDDGCHPHAVEVVHLGCVALTVCHDCRSDSGFLPRWDAERLAGGHREQTRLASAPLLCVAA